LRHITFSTLEVEEDGWCLRISLPPVFAASCHVPYSLPLLFPPTTSTQHLVLIVSSVARSSLGFDGPTQESNSDLTCGSLFSNYSC